MSSALRQLKGRVKKTFKKNSRAAFNHRCSVPFFRGSFGAGVGSVWVFGTALSSASASTARSGSGLQTSGFFLSISGFLTSGSGFTSARFDLIFAGSGFPASSRT